MRGSSTVPSASVCVCGGGTRERGAFNTFYFLSRDASSPKRNRRKMAAERQVAGSGGGGRGSGSAGGGGATSMAALEDNKENEKPKSGDLGDSLGLESILPARWRGER